MSFPLPECVHAADLEIYIREERDLGISKTIQGHYYYRHPLQEDDGESIDPRTLVRPSAPLFGRYIEGEDNEEEESMESYDSDITPDRKDASDGDIWLEDISISDERDLKDLFSCQLGYPLVVPTDASNILPSPEVSCSTAPMSADEESGSEDGEGESLYEKVYFGRNRVQMSFVAYKQEWEEAYDYISQGMSGMFYFPYPRPQPQCQWKPKSQSKRKNSRLHDLVQELKKTTEDSRSQSEECLISSRRTNKLAPPPLRVRLLSASLQNRAMAARDALFQHEYSSGAPPLPKHCTEDKESLESLHNWELRAIESLYELEKI